MDRKYVGNFYKKLVPNRTGKAIIIILLQEPFIIIIVTLVHLCRLIYIFPFITTVASYP